MQGFNGFAVPNKAQMPMCYHVYVPTCAQHNTDPSGQAFPGQVPVDRESIRKEDDEKGWWLLWRWGPAEKEQPSNEEPSEASIHLEHGPLQLP